MYVPISVRLKSGKSTMNMFPLKKGMQLQIQSLLAVWNPQTYPAIHKILIITILLATTVPGQCSLWTLISALRRVNLWNSSTINGWGTGLVDLGMLLIHRGMDYIPEPEVIYHKRNKTGGSDRDSAWVGRPSPLFEYRITISSELGHNIDKITSRVSRAPFWVSYEGYFS